jgi:hypothetical protein
MSIARTVGLCAMAGGFAGVVAGWATLSFATALSVNDAAVTASTAIVAIGGCMVVLGASLLAVEAVLRAGGRAGGAGMRG